MPNTSSAIRRVKRSESQTFINRIRKSKYKSAVKEMANYISEGKIKEAEKFLPKFNSKLMKIAKTGVLKKKTASRIISKATHKIKKLKK
tara:strand:+ start:10107 stop:10373 length:267 start_codon:yes stop_codon:yes gene_type:complete